MFIFKFLFFWLFLLIALAATCDAQSPFKPQPKLGYPERAVTNAVLPGAHIAGVTTTDSIVNNWRFGVSVSPAGFNLKGVYQAAAGLEFGINHQDYNYASQSYTTLWSANIVWIPINTAMPIKSIKDIATFGALYGIPKIKLFGYNVVQIGPFYNPNAVGSFSDKAGFWVVTNISL